MSDDLRRRSGDGALGERVTTLEVEMRNLMKAVETIAESTAKLTERGHRADLKMAGLMGGIGVLIVFGPAIARALGLPS